MKPLFIRRHRRRSAAAKSEGAFFKKESHESFFGGAEHETFFQPAATVAPAQGQTVQRKCEECEGEEKDVQREPEKKEEEKVQRAEDKKEEEKIQREPEKKEEEKVQRKCEDCEKEDQAVQREPEKKEDQKIMKADDKKEEDKVVQKKEGQGTGSSASVSNYISTLSGKGQPLPSQANYFFSSRMGHDFSNVKIHNDKEAATSAKTLNANAYAVGNNIVFNDSQYNVDSSKGQRLLAHELTHTIQQGESPKRIQKKDSDFESITGAGEAIATGTMTADAGMGKTFAAPNCRSIYGCNVGFKFTKLYKGDYFFKYASRDVRGVYTKIESVYDPKICGACDRLRMIQVIRYTTKGSTAKMETAEPTSDTRRKRAGWNDPKARSRGWFVDELDSQSDPFRDSPSRYSFDSQTGVGDVPAIAWDAPASFTDKRNDGKEFQTFLVCEPNVGGKGKVIGGVNWGYYIDGSGSISFMPASPIATCGPTEELQNAATRWDTFDENTKTRINFTAEKPISHYGSQSALWFKEGGTSLQNDEVSNSEEIFELALRKARQHLMATMPAAKIILHCYTGKGEGELNFDLSWIRAESIRARLTAAGIPDSVIEIKQHPGETVNQAKLGLNRKVVIELSDSVDRSLNKALLRSF